MFGMAAFHFVVGDVRSLLGNLLTPDFLFLIHHIPSSQRFNYRREQYGRFSQVLGQAMLNVPTIRLFLTAYKYNLLSPYSKVIIIIQTSCFFFFLCKTVQQGIPDWSNGTHARTLKESDGCLIAWVMCQLKQCIHSPWLRPVPSEVYRVKSEKHSFKTAVKSRNRF